MEEPSYVRMGEMFPEMTVRTTQGKIDLPGHFKGRWFLLFSHPADFTPVCTTEFYSFSKHYDDFQALDCDLIGHSVDFVFGHLKWIEWMEDNLNVKVPFPIIADTYAKVANRLGFIHPVEGVGAVRSVLIVSPEGRIKLILYYPQRVGRNVKEILRMLNAMQIAERNDVAMPANWPENELIGDEVLLEPPKDVEGMEARKKAEGCFDWWFCHKKIDY